MKPPRQWIVAGLLVLVLHFSSILVAGGTITGKVDEKVRRKRRPTEEVDDDAVFAAAVLGLVHDRVRDVGNIFRIVGDTAGAVTGGTIKAVGATVNGLSSVLDAASRSVDTKLESELVDQPPPRLPSNGDSDVGEAQSPKTSWAAPPEADESRPSETSPHARKGEKNSNNPDPLDRIESVTRSSLAGSLKLVSAAVRGVGDAVFQAGTVAEGLAGGTGQVAEDLVRVVQGAVGWARDDMLEFNTRSNLARDIVRGGAEGRPEDWPPGEAPATPSSERLTDDLSEQTASSSSSSSVAAALTVQKACRGISTLTRVGVTAALLEVAALFRRSHGALPPAPRFAVLLVVALVIWARGRRRRSPPPPPPPPPSPSLSPRRETAAPGAPQRDSSFPQGMDPTVGPDLGRNDVNQGPPTAVAAEAAGLSSPSRSLLIEPRFPELAAVAAEAISPVRWRAHDGPDGLDPSLPSPAQVRAAQGRTGAAQTSMLRGMARRHRARDVGEAAVAVERRGIVAFIKWRRGWDWGWGRGWTRFRERWSGGSQRYWVWLVLLWLVASVLEERERDRVAWLAWDEGFRRGQASRTVDPNAQEETVAWLNHLVDSVWGGQGKAASIGAGGVDRGGGALDGLSSFISERMAESILEALEEMKPTSVVGVELQDVELGSSSPQILGVKMLDPTAATSPGWDDGRCTRGGECVSIRVDLEVATQGLRVGVGVKASSLEKALLPTGTVRLLEFYFRGSVAIRAELRKEFPFVGTTLVAVDGVPEMRVRIEQWGLDALTLGAVDEWAQIGLQQAIRPFVLPRFIEVDAAHHICPECPPSTTTEVPAGEGQTEGDAPSTPFGLPTSRLPAAAAAGWMVHPPEIKRSSSGGPGSPKALRPKETNTDSRHLSKGKVKKWNPGSSSQGRSAAPVAPAFEAERSGSGAGRMGPSTAAKVAEGSWKKDDWGGGGIDRLKSGRAAAMSELYEYRGGMGGALQWLKDHVSDKITGGGGGEEPEVIEWEGVD